MSDVHYLQGYSHPPGRSGRPGGLAGIGPPPKTVRLTDTPLVGYRFWKVERRTGRLGEVQGMGRCVVHERGWRAGVARIVTLFVDPAFRFGLRRKLRARYRCEVQTYEPSTW